MRRFAVYILATCLAVAACLSAGGMGAFAGDHTYNVKIVHNVDGVTTDHDHSGHDDPTDHACPDGHVHCCCAAALPSMAYALKAPAIAGTVLFMPPASLGSGELTYPLLRPPRNTA